MLDPETGRFGNMFPAELLSMQFQAHFLCRRAALTFLQSRTNKVNKSGISVPGQYFDILFLESYPAYRNMSKNTSPKFFPRADMFGQIFGPKN
jgi:hypothetical protein